MTRADDNLLERAGELLRSNTRSGVLDGRRYSFSVPSTEAYPFQWFWDSCFHAIVWARLDVARAQEELRGLFAHQLPDGSIPHVVFWDRSRVSRTAWHYLESRGRFDAFVRGRAPQTTAMIQPPVIAQAVEAIAAAGGDDFIGETLPALERYYRYLCTERDPDGDGLISIIAQFESGLDFSPAYDRRPARLITLHSRGPELLNKLVDYKLNRVFSLNAHHVEDVLVNSVHADGLQALARLAASAGATGLARWAADQARRVVDALLERCYDERRGLFFNLVGRNERRADHVKTVHSLMPLLLADLPDAVTAALAERLTDKRLFWAPYPVPSVAMDEPTFLRDSMVHGRRRIWRGPCSLNTNWLLARGLRRHGFDDVADRVADRSRAMVEGGGFNEFFDPLSGSPVGVSHFGWATLAAAF